MDTSTEILDRKLDVISKEKEENSLEIQTLKRTEVELDDFKQRASRLFDWILSTNHRDPREFHYLEFARIDTENQVRNYFFEVEDEKERLYLKRKKLYDAEEAVYHEKKILNMEEA
ncbi:DUF3958 family protein [Listeria booriae]|uniref:DUF3958 family protein n=1 Tax=Listeria booriae TaxID=1552123 RepID=UPI001629B130|nr:DUF3958 family protein [Listeria booriae]MBC2019812.1 DUF3958 family protein [Listeria booriae]